LGTAFALLVPFTYVVVACGGESAAASAGASGEAASQRAEPADAAGTLELGETSYAFPSVSCDLEDSQGTGMLVRAFGKAADGRGTVLEVERLHLGHTTHERVTVTVGKMMEGDVWEARAEGWPDGRWFSDAAGSRPLDGPLIVVADGVVSADGAFRQEKGDLAREGALRIRCPS
jgi:hypothetical protein